MKKLLPLMLIFTLLLTACGLDPKSNDPEVKNWELIKQSAENTEVIMAVDHSNGEAIEWLRGTFSEYLKSEYQVTLKLVEQSLTKTVAELTDEKRREVTNGQVDIILIENNGFKEAYENGILYGPFADKLPNIKSTIGLNALSYVAKEGIDTGHYWVPYGRKQLTFIYNQDVFYETPENIEGLKLIMEENKGTITYPDPRKSEEGLAFVLSIIGESLDFEPYLSGNFKQAAFLTAIQPGMDQLMAMKPMLKDSGMVYPASLQALDDLFINGGLSVSYTMDMNYVTDKLREYEYPEGASTFVIPSGVATFYEGAVIAYNSVNKSGAMVVLNALLSPEMQASKCDPKGWGSLPVYEMDIVTEEALTPFKSIKLKGTTVKALEYIEAAKPEFSPQMIAVILAEWERRISAGE